MLTVLWRVLASVPDRSGPTQNSYKPDPAKSDLANALDVLRELTTTTPADEVWRLSLLSAFVKLLGADSTAGDDDHNGELPLQRQAHPRRRRRCIADIVPGHEFWYCLSASLVQPVTQIRAATLRAMRHLVRGAADVRAFNELQLPHLLCKSLDVLLDNEEERVQAMKLVCICVCSLWRTHPHVGWISSTSLFSSQDSRQSSANKYCIYH